LNLEKYDEWKDDKMMINDVMRFLDNVLTDFIERAPEQFDDAKYSAEKERSVGLGRTLKRFEPL
jgi:ribonucleoside-diphosphate reductase alpha chain